MLAGVLITLSACTSSGPVVPPPAPHIAGVGVVDSSVGSCVVSYDGFVWYNVPAGNFSPIDVRQEKCAPSSLGSTRPAIPSWAKPAGPTKTIFVATSLQEAYSVAGMQSIEAAASTAHVPVTWLIGNPMYLGQSALYNQYHQSNGDDVQVEHDASLISATESALPWYRPTVSVEGAGHERDIAGAIALGENAFWGIAWDQSGVDGTTDVGAPWGTYCADITSYKRPTPDGTCAMLAFEWTARDLTRAYLSGHPEYFSTDPDDLQQRGGFTVDGPSAYERELAEAYAAAGQTQPMVMVSQQESAENLNTGDQTILSSLYQQAVADGMHAETLAQAASDARTFSAQPRAIAFPSIPGGAPVPSPIIAEQTLYPATVDFHDNAAGMTFLAGHTAPARVFEYSVDTSSYFNVPLAMLNANRAPVLTNVASGNGQVVFALQSPSALHYGLALWADNTELGITGPGVTPAGHAEIVLTFDVQPGANTIAFRCAACSSTTFRYST